MKYIMYKGKKIDVEDIMLDLDDKGIEDISEIIGLEFLTDLRVLKLNNNKIKEIKGLETLINLEELYLAENQISEIKGLKNLKSLEVLHLYDNEITQIKCLENLLNLRELWLGDFLSTQGNRIVEIKGLKNNRNLEVLRLNNNKIEEIKGLNNLRDLYILDLSGNNINEIKGLDKLRNLNELLLSGFNGNNINEIKNLEKLKKLNYLNLSDNNIKVVKGIENLSSLEAVLLGGNQIKRVGGFRYEKLPQKIKDYLDDPEIDEEGRDIIEFCQINRNWDHDEGYIIYKEQKYFVSEGVLNLHGLGIHSIDELKGLDKLTNLEVLDLRKNYITEIKGLENFTGLIELYITSEFLDEEHHYVPKIRYIKGLENLINIEILDLSGNEIEEIKGLETLTNLIELYLGMYNDGDINGNEVKEIKGLKNLKKLEILDISFSSITEIKGLEKLRNLRELYLEGNHISEIKGLEHLNKLQVLNLARNEKINELKGLENLINLQELCLGRYDEEGFNRIEEIKGLDNLINLRILDISDNMVSKINLKKQKKLNILFLQNNEMNKIPDGLENLTNLEYLFLDMNYFHEIEGLENLINLKYLNLGSDRITKIKDLENLENLDQINVNLDENLKQEIRMKQKILPKRFEAKNFAQILVEYCKIIIEEEEKAKIKEQKQKEIYYPILLKLKDKAFEFKENEKIAEYLEKAYQKLLEMDAIQAQKELFDKLVQYLDGAIGFVDLKTVPINNFLDLKNWYDNLQKGEVNQFNEKNNDNLQKGEFNHFDEKNILRKVLIKCYEKLVEIDPNYFHYWHELGVNYEKIGNKKKAIQAYEKFFDLEPKDIKEIYGWGRGWTEFGELYENEGLYDRALEFYKKSLDCYKKEHAIRKANIIKIKIADVYELQGNLEKALKNFEELIPIFEKNDPYYNLIINRAKELRNKIFPQWIEILPFPLASILWLYISDANIEHKIEHLFHFFEATSEFLVMIILSAFYIDKQFYEQERYKWIERDPKYQDWYKTPSFGSWNQLGRRLSKALRVYLNDINMRKKNLNRFRLSNEFSKTLSEKNIYAVLERVADWRNLWKGHGGITDEKELKLRLSNLENSLEEIRELFGNFDNVMIIKPFTMRLSGGTFYHLVESVTGTRTPFKKQDLELKESLDSENLYLFDKNSKTSLAIELLPFMRIMSSPSDEKNACYFYNRIKGDKVRWVSYHFSKEAEIVIPDKKLVEILSIFKSDGD